MKQRWTDYAILASASVLLWQAAYYFAGSEAIAPPIETVRRLGVLMDGARFWGHARATGVAFVYAGTLALAGGLVLGIAIGASRTAHEILTPILSTLYSIPKIMLYPVILLVFGLGLSAKVAFGAMHGFFPVALFAIGAIRNIPPVLLRTARVMRLSRLDLVRNILLPAALPEIVTGLRIGFSATLLGTLMGELFASSEGLGFLLIRAMDIHNVPDIMALTLLLFLVATAANILILAVERRVHSHGT
ncbi:MAG: ABC transporter permease subunit [Bryobacteraceae bacterium]|jgi:NitT/TauT family transport system permease protein